MFEPKQNSIKHENQHTHKNRQLLSKLEDILRQQQQHTQLISHRSNATVDRNGNTNANVHRNVKDIGNMSDSSSYRPTRSVAAPQTAKKMIKVFNGVYYQYL